MKCFKEIGFFDPKLFLFYEDDDLCIKAKNAGYGLVLTPEAKVTHFMGASSPSTLKIIYLKNRHLLWSRLYLQEKYTNKQNARMLSIAQLYLHFAKFLLNICTYNLKKSAKSCGKMVGCLCYFIGLKP
jgi:GT2 family glycosyltransferase